MPKAFEKCRKAGGRIRTVKPKGKRSRSYMPVCYKDGKSYAGEVKKRRPKKRGR